MQKVYVNSENKATLACPACERSRTIDATPYMALSRAVRMRLKCPCGHRRTAALERRRHFRKPVHLEGAYSKVDGNANAEGEAATVLDLSRTGVRLRVDRNRTIRVGDRLMVAFRLDDTRRSAVRKESVVRRIQGADLGAEFTASEPADPNTKAIGFYLFAA